MVTNLVDGKDRKNRKWIIMVVVRILIGLFIDWLDAWHTGLAEWFWLIFICRTANQSSIDWFYSQLDSRHWLLAYLNPKDNQDRKNPYSPQSFDSEY